MAIIHTKKTDEKGSSVTVKAQHLVISMHDHQTTSAQAQNRSRVSSIDMVKASKESD